MAMVFSATGPVTANTPGMIHHYKDKVLPQRVYVLAPGQAAFLIGPGEILEKWLANPYRMYRPAGSSPLSGGGTSHTPGFVSSDQSSLAYCYEEGMALPGLTGRVARSVLQHPTPLRLVRSIREGIKHRNAFLVLQVFNPTGAAELPDYYTGMANASDLPYQNLAALFGVAQQQTAVSEEDMTRKAYLRNLKVRERKEARAHHNGVKTMHEINL
jgi:hypothetical protein